MCYAIVAGSYKPAKIAIISHTVRGARVVEITLFSTDVSLYLLHNKYNILSIPSCNSILFCIQ